MQFVNSALGRELHLRGVNARVVEPGTIRVGHVARKLAPDVRNSLTIIPVAAPDLEAR